jgi:hypothetical protein
VGGRHLAQPDGGLVIFDNLVVVVDGIFVKGVVLPAGFGLVVRRNLARFLR